MTADSTFDWALELARLSTSGGARFDTRILSARHKPTGNEILLFLDEHGCVARTQADVACPNGLLDEVTALFPECLRRDDA